MPLKVGVQLSIYMPRALLASCKLEGLMNATWIE